MQQFLRQVGPPTDAEPPKCAVLASLFGRRIAPPYKALIQITRYHCQHFSRLKQSMRNGTTKVSSLTQESRRLNVFQRNTFSVPLLTLILSACTASQQINDPYIAENAPKDCSFQTTNFDLFNTVEQMSPNAMASWPKVKSRFKSGLPEKNSCLLYTSPSPRDKRQSRMPSSA